MIRISYYNSQDFIKPLLLFIPFVVGAISNSTAITQLFFPKVKIRLIDLIKLCGRLLESVYH